MPTPRVDLFVDGAWEDVSAYVLVESGVEIQRGQQSESGSIQHQTAKLTFLNSTYRFTPRHPLSPYYGSLGRNTPIRIARDASVIGDNKYLFLAGDVADCASCPDSANLSFGDDIDVRLEIELDNWNTRMDLISKWSGPDQLSWVLRLGSTGLLDLLWTTGGTAVTFVQATATTAIAADAGHIAVRFVLDVNNGAAGNTTTFYTSDTIGGSWTQLGSPVVNSGTTSIFDSSSDVVIGSTDSAADTTASGVGTPTINAKVYAAEIYRATVSSLRASPDFTAQAMDAASFTDGQGNVWTIEGDAVIASDGWRFHGEVSEWPVVADQTGTLSTVSVEASGQWRRIGQNEQPLHSAMFRAHTNAALTRVKAYWSLEDGAESVEAASGLPGHPAMAITGTPQMANYDGLTSSAAIPQMDTGHFYGIVPSYTPTGATQVYLFCFIDDAVADETDLLIVQTSGSLAKWKLRVDEAGNLRTQAYDRDDTEITTGTLGDLVVFNLNADGFFMIGIQFTQDGADIDWAAQEIDFLHTDTVDDALVTTQTSGTVTGHTAGRVKNVILNDDSGLGNVKLGHVVVSDETDTWLTDVADAIRAFNGENPSTRLLRLCHEEGLRCVIVTKATGGNSVTMGDQTIKTLTELLVETANTDLGILHEARELPALRYRTRLSLANQDPQVTLSYSDRQLGEPLHPVDDDQLTVNEQYVIRQRGTTAVRKKDTGRASTLKPKAGGAGAYSAEATISVTHDQQAADQAAFRLFLGTQDQARYPRIVVNLHHSSIADDPDLLAALLALDVGDRVVVTDVPDYLPPDDIDVLAVGYSERFDEFTHTMTLVCLPGQPWQWAVADDDDKRADTEGSETSGAFTSGTDTSMTVATTSGPVWINSTDHAADFPLHIRVSGVVLEVTAISGSTSPQTFTVTAAPVNGVAKVIPDGSAVEVATKAYVGMV
jgi:hypothetical protein